MKNGPKIAIVVVCLLAATGLVLYNMGIIGGSAPKSAQTQTTSTQSSGQTGSTTTQANDENQGTGLSTAPRRNR